ncbi:4a-hydroxytetrahydrobiopterin dehydratase [bacterium]|nr:4a-hydroxytetrahydrobiopterin dehydratase [bacterium]
MNEKSAGYSDLAKKHCKPCEGGTQPYSADEAKELMGGLPGWAPDGEGISRTFQFKNYYETMAFVNAVAWIAHREDHHPDMTVGYNTCKVFYTTHFIGGLSENDFICAAKVTQLISDE